MSRFIVLGAGILGASTAYHLAKTGAKVIIVDRQDVGQATDAAAGIVSPWLTQRRNKAWYRLARGGAKYFPTLVKDLESDGQYNIGYAQVGAIHLHTDENKLDQMEERAYQRREVAPEMGDIRRLSPAQTQQLFPPLEDGYGAVHVSGGARVNGRALRKALLYAAQRHGATLVHGDGTLLHEHNQVTGVQVEGQAMMADQVIVTAGAWARELFHPLGLHFSVTPQKAQIIHLEYHQAATQQVAPRADQQTSTEVATQADWQFDTHHWPVVMPPGNHYILAFDQGRIVVGSTHEDEAGFDTRVTAGGVHEMISKALATAPGLKQSTVLETRVGFRPFTPGFLPVLGTVPACEGVLVANGLGASGLTVGPYVGAELARFALGERTELDFGDYDVAGAIESH